MGRTLRTNSYAKRFIRIRKISSSWIPAQEPDDLKRAVHENLENLGLDVLDVVNLRVMGDGHGPSESSIAKQFSTLAALQQEGLIRHLGVSTVTAAQVTEAQGIAEVVCVQNQYNIVDRTDDSLIDDLAAKGIAYVPYFPLGGFTPIQSETLSKIASEVGATPMQLSLAWLLYRSPNILLIPGTSSREHLRENMKAAELSLSESVFAQLNEVAAKQ
jgi:pyridoxine 4-dehydrogenase